MGFLSLNISVRPGEPHYRKNLLETSIGSWLLLCYPRVIQIISEYNYGSEINPAYKSEMSNSSTTEKAIYISHGQKC